MSRLAKTLAAGGIAGIATLGVAVPAFAATSTSTKTCADFFYQESAQSFFKNPTACRSLPHLPVALLGGSAAANAIQSGVAPTGGVSAGDGGMATNTAGGPPVAPAGALAVGVGLIGLAALRRRRGRAGTAAAA